MFKNNFRPSRDPSKGYQATFGNFISYCMDEGIDLMEGTVTIARDSDFVARQLWSHVASLISFSSGLMNNLLDTLHVSTNDISPFCRDFVSLEDLRDEFIGYLPSTFHYDDVHGERSDVAAEDDEGEESQTSDAEKTLADRVARFAADFAALSSGANNNSAADVNDVQVTDGTTGEATPATSNRPNNNSELMNVFRSIVAVPSADDLLPNVSIAATYIEWGRECCGGNQCCKEG